MRPEQIGIVGNIGGAKHRKTTWIQQRVNQLKDSTTTARIKINQHIPAEHDIGLLQRRLVSQQVELLEPNKTPNIRMNLPGCPAFDR